jgi:hypothetical protein
MYCTVLLVQLVVREAGKEPAVEILNGTEREILRYIQECLQGFELSRLN